MKGASSPRLASLLAPALVLAISAVAGSAHAQSAQAESLFKEGKALIKSGKLAAGCDKLAASESAESSVGTLLNLGDCREKLGQTATAWATFEKAAATAKRAGDDEQRRAEATRRASVLEPKLTRLTLVIAHPPAGTTVLMNGDTMDAAAWNTPLPVDPATYAIVVQAPGYVPYRTNIVLLAGTSRRSVAIPPLVVSLVAPVAPIASGGPVGPVAPFAPQAATFAPVQPGLVVAGRATTPTWSATRGVAVGAGIVGAAALGAGIYFGVHANDLRDRSNALCPDVLCPDPEGLRLNDDAKRSATRANLGYAVGGGAIAGAIVLWMVGRPRAEVSIAPAVGRDSAGATVAGRF